MSKRITKHGKGAGNDDDDDDADVGNAVADLRPAKADEEAYRKRRQKEILQINALSGAVLKQQIIEHSSVVQQLPGASVRTADDDADDAEAQPNAVVAVAAPILSRELAANDDDFADVDWEEGARWCTQ